MVKLTRQNSTVGKQQPYTCTDMKKILTLVTDSAFMVKLTRQNSIVGNQQQYTYTNM